MQRQERKMEEFALHSCPLFKEIRPEEIFGLLHCLSARKRAYEKGQTVLQAGDTVDHVGLVLSGSVHVIKEDFWGNRTILARVAPLSLFGEAFACIPQKPATVGVVATEETEILWINARKVLKTCPSACVFHSQMIQNLLEILAFKNIMLTDKMEQITKRTTREKLMSYLSMQAMQAGSDSFEIPFDRQELADYLSVDRSALSRTLAQMQEDGVVSYQRNRFTLCQ